MRSSIGVADVLWHRWLWIGLFSMSLGTASVQSTSALQVDTTQALQLAEEGQRRLENEDFLGASQSFEASLKFDQNNGLIWHQLGYAYFKQDRQRDSIGCFMIGASFDASRDSCLYNLACHFSLAQESEFAIDYLRQSFLAGYNDFEHIDSDPDLDFVRELQEFKDLVANARNGLTATPEQASADAAEQNKLAGLSLLEAELYQLASEKLLKSLESDEQNDEVWLSAGYAIQMSGALDQAERCYRQAVNLNPANVLAWYNLGCISSLKNNPDEAFRHLELASKAGFDDVAQMQSDTDLANVRGDARFSTLLAAVQVNSAKKSENESGELAGGDHESIPAGNTLNSTATTNSTSNSEMLADLSSPSKTLEEAIAKLTRQMPRLMQLINQGKSFEVMVSIRGFVDGSRNVIGGQPEFGIILGMLATAYAQMNDFRNARPFADEAVKLIGASEGKQSPRYWDALELQAGIIMELLDFSAARAIFADVAEAKRQSLGTGDVSYASSVINEAFASAFLGYAESRIVNVEQALKVIANKLGKTSPGYLDALSRSQRFYIQANLRDRIEQTISEMRTLAETSTQPEVQVLARLQIATYLSSQARLNEALVLMEEAIRIQEQQQAMKSFLFLRCQLFLAMLHANMTDWSKADSVLVRAKQSVIDMFGAESVDNAGILHLLGEAKAGQSAYAEAEKNFLDATAILQRVSAESHPNLAIVSISLGKLYVRMGARQRAEPLFIKAAKIQRDIFGAESAQHSEVLHLLGIYHTGAGNFQKAERNLKETLQIAEKIFGDGSPHIAAVQRDLARLYVKSDELDKAEPLLKQAMKSLEKELPQLKAECASDLGDLYARKQEYSLAEQILLESERTLERAVGKENESTAATMLRLGEMYRQKGELEKATQWYQENRVSVRQHTARVLPGLSTDLQLNYLENEFQPSFHSSLALGYTLRDNQRARVLSAGWLLNGKGLVQEVLGEGALLSSSEAAPLVFELRAVRDEMAKLTLNLESDSQKRKRQIVQVADLETRQRDLVQRIATSSGTRNTAQPWVSVGQLRESLPFGTTLVSIARFSRDSDPQVDAKVAAEAKSTEHYVAWIIPSIGDGEVEIVDLGQATEIDALIEDVRTALQQAGKRLFEVGEKDAAREFAAPMSKLSERIVQPLWKFLGKTEHLIISPDSNLWLIPWAAALIPIDNNSVESGQSVPENNQDKQFLIERFPISYVISGRELVATSTTRSLISPAAIFADPDFDLQASSREGEAEQSGERSLSGLKFNRLFGTAEEARAIKSLVEKFHGETPTVYLQADATESTLKQLHRPRALVISTHGFFAEASESQTSDSRTNLPAATVRGESGQVFENPLLRCGLALAGCNLKQSDLEGVEDGILTGLEIVGTDLRGTELVVLSACETGVGQTSQGEGVAGLRQAFQQAGAESVVASLWKVPDVETTELMTLFWNGLSENQAKPMALRQAQLDIIRNRQAKHGAAHPWYWAAFTLTGAR